MLNWFKKLFKPTPAEQFHNRPHIPTRVLPLPEPPAPATAPVIMRTPLLRKGQRVQTLTRLGGGVVVGFEIIDGNNITVVDDDPRDNYPFSRVIVALDDPSLWVCRADTCTHPYFFRGDIDPVSTGHAEATI